MIASVQSFPRPAAESLHAGFLELLPRIERHARIYFRHVACPNRRADRVAEVLALAWKWYRRLAERGKDAAAFPMALASLAARAVRSGRRLAGQEKARDVMSSVAQQRHGFVVESLPASTATSHESLYATVDGQQRHDEWEERLAENRLTPVPEQAAFRIDWPAFVRSLSRRDRKLLRFLSLGHANNAAAAKFQLSPGRVSQLRKVWCREWHARHGEEPPFACRPAR